MTNNYKRIQILFFKCIILIILWHGINIFRRCKGYVEASMLPPWLYHCNVCDQGRSVGKIMFTRNRKMIGGWVPPTEFLFQKNVGHFEKKLKSKTLNGAFWRNMKRCFGSWNLGETFENKDANWWFLAVFETMILKLEMLIKI